MPLRPRLAHRANWQRHAWNTRELPYTAATLSSLFEYLGSADLLPSCGSRLHSLTSGSCVTSFLRDTNLARDTPRRPPCFQTPHCLVEVFEAAFGGGGSWAVC